MTRRQKHICIYSNGSVSETKLTNDVEIHYHREILETFDQRPKKRHKAKTNTKTMTKIGPFIKPSPFPHLALKYSGMKKGAVDPPYDQWTCAADGWEVYTISWKVTNISIHPSSPTQ